MEKINGKAIKADFKFPEGKGVVNYNGSMVFAYKSRDKNTGSETVKAVTRDDFAKISGGAQGFPPLVRIFNRGNNHNVGFLHMWVTSSGNQSGMMHWRIGELLTDKTFEEINWKAYSQIPGRKNKGIGSGGDAFNQGLFEGAGRWVDKRDITYCSQQTNLLQINFTR